DHRRPCQANLRRRAAVRKSGRRRGRSQARLDARSAAGGAETDHRADQGAGTGSDPRGGRMMPARLAFALLATVLAAIVAIACGAQAQGSQRILIDRVQIMDGHGGPPRAGRVLVEGERIARILSEGAAIDGAYAAIDGEGGYLVPGFIDMHAHLMQSSCKT